MLRFKNYLSEEVRPAAGVKSDSIDIENLSVRGQINSTLASVTAQPAVTPYIVMHRISKALAYFHITLPKRAYLEGDRGVEVIEVKQFGHKMGMTNDGQFVHDIPSKYFLFISYRLSSSMGADYAAVGDILSSVGGMFKVTAKLVDEVELQRLLSMAEVSLAEDCDAAEQQQKYKAMAPKEKMHTALGDCDCSQGDSPSTKSAVDTSMRKKDRKLSAASLDEDKDPCWKGYEMIGMKKKGGKPVPNCVPVKEENIEEGQVTGPRSYKGSSDRKRKAVQMALGRKHKDHPDWNERTNPQHSALTLGRKLQKQGIKEEEQIDEAGYDKLDKYVRRAHVSGTGAAARGEIAMHRGQKTRLLRANKTGEKREQGINLALDKMAGRALIPARRKEKQIDELYGKGSLGKIKAHHDTEAEKASDKGRSFAKTATTDGTKLSKKMKFYGKLGSIARKGEHHEAQSGRASDMMKKMKKKNVKEEQIDEKLTKAMSAGDVISDFVHSKDPKFKGKSKKMRQKMALGAYYGMHPEKKKSLEEMASRLKKTTAHRKMAVGVNTKTSHDLGKKKSDDTKTILVTRKGDPRAAAGGGVRRIPKDKFDPSIYNRASE